MSTAARKEPDDREWKARLGRAAARRARAEADFYSTVAEIGGAVPQTQIADVLHTTQSNVSRWAARGREQQLPEGQLARSPYEVAQRYAAGEITREQMLRALIKWEYVPELPAEKNDWYGGPEFPRGSFEETTARAYRDGLLPGEDYDAILNALADPEPVALPPSEQ